MKSLARVVSNSLHFLFSNLLGFAMGMVASIVMARTLGPNDLGIFHQAQWFAGTLSFCLSLGFMTTVTKFTAQYRAEGRHADISSAVRFVYRVELAIGLLATVGLLLFALPIADHYFSPNESPLFILAFLAITPGLQTAVLSSAMEGAQIFRYQSVHAMTLTPLSLIAKIVLLVQGYGLVGLFWCNLAFALFNLGFYHWAVKREGLLEMSNSNATHPPKPWKGELLSYTRSIIGIQFVDLLVWSRSENYFLGRFCQAAEIAYYNLAQNLLLRFTGILPNLMWKMLLPLTADHHGREDRAKLGRTYQLAMRYAACLSFPIITTCFFASFELIVIFYGHLYAEAKTCFQILSLGALLTSLAQPGSAALYATDRQNFILRYGLVLAVFNIALNFWIIPKYGATGAAASYAITTGLGAIGGFVYTWHALGFSLPFGSFLRCGIASMGLAAVLAAALKMPVEPFDFFAGVSRTLRTHTGHGLEMLLGARTLRLLLALSLGVTTYAFLLLLLAKPNSDDVLVMESLRRYLPRPFAKALHWAVMRKQDASILCKASGQSPQANRAGIDAD